MGRPDKWEAERQQRCLNRYAEMQRHWAKYAHKISSRLDRDSSDNMLVRSRDYRRIVEVRQMLDAAKPPNNHKEDWQMTLRGDEQAERYVPIGSVFSGLFVKVQGQHSKPIVRTAVPGSSTGKMAAVADRIASQPQARNRLRYLSHDLAPIEADTDGLLIEGHPLPTRAGEPFPDTGEETLQIALDEPETQEGEERRPETRSRATPVPRIVRIETPADTKPRPGITVTAPEPTHTLFGGIISTFIEVENTGNTVIECTWTKHPKATVLLGLDAPIPSSVDISPKTRAIIPGESFRFRVIGTATSPGVEWNDFSVKTTPPVDRIEVIRPSTDEVDVSNRITVVSVTAAEVAVRVDDVDLDTFHNDLDKRAINRGISEIVDSVVDTVLDPPPFDDDEVVDLTQVVWDGHNARYGLALSRPVFEMLDAVSQSAAAMLTEGGAEVDGEGWDMNVDRLYDMVMGLPGTPAPTDETQPTQPPSATSEETEEEEVDPTPPEPSARQTHLDVMATALQLASLPAACTTEEEFVRFRAVRDKVSRDTLMRRVAVGHVIDSMLRIGVTSSDGDIDTDEETTRPESRTEPDETTATATTAAVVTARQTPRPTTVPEEDEEDFSDTNTDDDTGTRDVVSELGGTVVSGDDEEAQDDAGDYVISPPQSEGPELFEAAVPLIKSRHTRKAREIDSFINSVKTAKAHHERLLKKHDRKQAEKRRIAAEVGEEFVPGPEDAAPAPPTLPPQPVIAFPELEPVKTREVGRFDQLIRGPGGIFYVEPEPEPVPEPEPEEMDETKPAKSARGKRTEEKVVPEKTPRSPTKGKKVVEPEPEPAPEPEEEAAPVDHWAVPEPVPLESAAVDMLRPVITRIVDACVEAVVGAPGVWGLLKAIEDNLVEEEVAV